MSQNHHRVGDLCRASSKALRRTGRSFSMTTSLENNINSKQVPEGQASTQYIFHTLSSYKRIFRGHPTANVAQSTYSGNINKGTMLTGIPRQRTVTPTNNVPHLHEQHDKNRSQIPRYRSKLSCVSDRASTHEIPCVDTPEHFTSSRAPYLSPYRFACSAPPDLHASRPSYLHASTSLRLNRVSRDSELHTSNALRLHVCSTPPALHTSSSTGLLGCNASPELHTSISTSTRLQVFRSSTFPCLHVATPKQRPHTSMSLRLQRSFIPRRPYTCIACPEIQSSIPLCIHVYTLCSTPPALRTSTSLQLTASLQTSTSLHL